MTRILSCCRWCGAPPPPSTDPQGRGRPPAFCTDTCRRAHVAAFGATSYSGAVQLAEDCGGACGWHGTVEQLAAPVRGPGAFAAAAAAIATALHGHDVTVHVRPCEAGFIDSGATSMSRPANVGRGIA